MSFDLIAKSLLSQTAQKSKPRDDAGVLADLENAGFARADLLHEYRNLYDSTEDDGIRQRILKDIAQIHQLMSKDDNKRDTPNITINVFGDNARVAAMLNPNPVLISSEGEAA